MSFGSKLTFRGVTRAIFARLRKRASKRGIHVMSPSGEAEADGVRLQWTYDAEAEILEVGCVHTPFWIDPAVVNSRLQEEIEEMVNWDVAA